MKQYDKPECTNCPARKSYIAHIEAAKAYQKRNRKKISEYMKKYREK